MTNQTQTNPANNTPAIDLSANFILMRVKTRSWNNNKSVKDVAQEMEVQQGAKVGKALKASKMLLDADALKPVTKALAAITAKHRELTSVWDEAGGNRLLSTRKYYEYHQLINPLIVEFNAKADELAKIYPDLQDEARTRLGNLFDVDNYPQGSEFRAMFNVQLIPKNLDTSHNARSVALPAGELERIEQAMKDQHAENIKRVQYENWNRLFLVTSSLRDSLKKYHAYLVDPNASDTQKCIHKTLVEQIELACQKSSEFNLNDPALDEQIAVIRRELSVDIEALRGNSHGVNDTATKADVISGRMKAKAKDLAGYLN